MKFIDKNILVILMLKISLLYLFSSEYTRGLFQPFIGTITLENLNPYQFYLENNLNLNSFPYHGLMLFILYPFYFFSDLFSLELIFKTPLLLADLGILYVLLKLFPHKKNKIYMFYFINPIVIYSIYIHAQLDIVPTALLFGSIYFLTLNKYIWSSLFFAFSLATKIHILVAFPLIIFYIYKKEGFEILFKYIIISLSVFLLIDLPFIFSDGFLNMVILNKKQSLLFDSYYNIGGVKLLLPVAAILSIYFHFFNKNKINDDLLFFYFGLLFTVLVFFIYPAPAWYIWIIPFISIYFIQHDNKNKSMILYSVFSFFYLLFFIFFYKSEYKDILFLGNEINLKIDNENLRDISFTFLESMLLAIVYAFYKYGIKSNAIYKNKNKNKKNLVIGVGGDSGVGKSTLIESLKGILGNQLLQIEGDGEHKWERGDENWSKFTHLDPKANYIHKQADAIYNLRNNKEIYRSEYDHSTGKFTKDFKVIPKDFIVIAGLHPFYLPKLRKNLDLKFYIDTDESLRRHWKIIRDTEQRGYSKEKILEQIESRMGDAKKYIYPQKYFSDMVIKYFPINDFDLGNPKELIELGLKVTLDANIHIEGIIEKIDSDFFWDYNEDLKSQYIVLRSMPKIEFKDIAIDTIENINEIVDINVRWHTGYDGFIQLLLLKMISEKLKEER